MLCCSMHVIVAIINTFDDDPPMCVYEWKYNGDVWQTMHSIVLRCKLSLLVLPLRLIPPCFAYVTTLCASYVVCPWCVHGRNGGCCVYGRNGGAVCMVGLVGAVCMVCRFVGAVCMVCRFVHGVCMVGMVDAVWMVCRFVGAVCMVGMVDAVCMVLCLCVLCVLYCLRSWCVYGIVFVDAVCMV